MRGCVSTAGTQNLSKVASHIEILEKKLSFVKTEAAVSSLQGGFSEWQWKDHLKFQRYLYSSQHPLHCNASTHLMAHERGDGLGANLREQVSCFLFAVEAGLTWTFPFTSKYATSPSCQQKNLECYFKLPSNCSVVTQPRIQEGCDCYNLDPKKMATLSGLTHVYSKAWFFSETALYLYRPNVRLLRFLGVLRKELSLPPTGQFLAVHIRHNDKVQGHWHKVEEYIEVLKRFMWTHSLYTVLLATDDPSALHAMQATLNNDSILQRESSSHGHNGTRVVTIPSKYLMPLVSPEGKLAPAARRLARGEVTDGHDEGLTLLAQAFLAAEARVLIGTQSSHYSRLMIQLQHMHQLRPPATGPPYFYDMDNEPLGSIQCRYINPSVGYKPLRMVRRSRKRHSKYKLTHKI